MVSARPPSASAKVRRVVAPDDCCSALCGPRAGGETFVCLSPTGCAAAGQPCVRAGDCCDLGCVAGTCGQPRCAAADDPCAADADCCDGACMMGRCAPMSPGCRPAGQRCAMAAECCGGACLDPGETGALICVLLPGCRVRGEACAGGSDCCSGRCDSMPDSNGSKCQALPGCRPTGEICREPKECCSGRCAPSAGRPVALRPRARVPAAPGAVRAGRRLLLGHVRCEPRGRRPLRRDAGPQA